MWSKMLLLSLNVLVLLAIVNGADGGNVVFKDQIVKKNPDNETVSVDHKMQSSSHSASESELNKKEMLALGLYDAMLNIDKSLNSLSTHDSKSDQNIVISPISIAAAMSLILLGAHGQTKTEVGKLFNFDERTIRQTTENDNQNLKNLGLLLNYFQANSGESLGTEVNLAKAVFIQNGYNITEYYRSAAKELINSELISVNFKMNGAQAQQTINQWVSNQTRGKINDIMPNTPLPDTKTVITSALYFTGEWEYPFFVNYTRIKPFYFGSNIESRKMAKQSKDFVYVPMMVGSSEVLYHKNDALEFKAIGLPYKGKKFISYFILPNSNVNLRDLIKKMNGNTVRNITKNTIPTEFTYFVPKMNLESFTNLRPVLQNLGINQMFDSSKADLSNMASEPHSYISDILHKVEIVVNEIGTVASAATVVTITRGGQTTFNINKPFIFFIHHVESDTVIFWSSVHKPTPYSTTPPNLNIIKKP